MQARDTGVTPCKACVCSWKGEKKECVAGRSKLALHLRKRSRLCTSPRSSPSAEFLLKDNYTSQRTECTPTIILSNQELLSVTVQCLLCNFGSRGSRRCGSRRRCYLVVFVCINRTRHFGRNYFDGIFHFRYDPSILLSVLRSNIGGLVAIFFRSNLSSSYSSSYAVVV